MHEKLNHVHCVFFYEKTGAETQMTDFFPTVMKHLNELILIN